MTAIKVISDHNELDNKGTLTHADLDSYVNLSAWTVVSGSPSPAPPSARRLVAGTGIILTDTGPGGALIITSVSASSSVGPLTSWMELPTGEPDGVNLDFTLLHAPVPQSALMFFVNGILQKQGTTHDYALTGSGNVVHMNYNYQSGSNVVATYPY